MNTHHLDSQHEALEILWRDLGTTREALQREYSNQYLRRQLVRGFSTFTEAQIYLMKSTVLFVRELVFQVLTSDASPHKAGLHEFFCVDYTAAEVLLLCEQNAEVTETGRLRTTSKYINAGRNLRFAQNCYLRAIKTGFTVNYQGKGWVAFQEVIALRNRLTHPKSKEDLTVSDEAIEQVIVANDWFYDTNLNMMRAGTQRLAAFSALLK